MQHLPFLPQTEIPYLGGPNYAGEGLEAFVGIQGWTRASLRQNNLEDRSPKSRLAFLQSLINIALPIEILNVRGVKATHKTFCPDGKLLDTSAMPGLINSMAMNGLNLDPVAREEQFSRVQHLIRFTSSCSPRQLFRTTEYLTLAMVCMLDTIISVMYRLGISSVNDELPTPDDISVQQVLLPSKLLIEAGWCPKQVSELQSSSIITQYYLTTLERDKAYTHNACTPQSCAGTKVESATYQTCHTTSCINCDHVAIDEAAVEEHISKGVVPRIHVRLSEQQVEPPELSVSGTGPYVAISHVWGHGRMTLYLLHHALALMISIQLGIHTGTAYPCASCGASLPWQENVCTRSAQTIPTERSGLIHFVCHTMTRRGKKH